jgi:uncharacterized membrane protein YgcG
MRTISKTLGLLLAIGLTGSASTAVADVNDFEFVSFDARYELTVNKDAGNIPEMVVTETLVALFPETDQNRGIRRDIPDLSYGKYPGLIQIVSVTDETGKARDFEETREVGFVSLAIKAQDDSFVYGRQTYVIKYRQSWVIGNFQDSSGFDEFYWDINGTGWLQKFGRVSAEVILDQFLAENVVLDEVSCYQGLTGSDLPCDESQLSANKLVFTAKNLEPGENLTVAIPFNPNLVNTAGPKVEGTPTWYLFWIAPALLVLLLLWAIYFRIFVIRSQGKKAFIVPQYKPTEEPGLLASGLIANKTSNLMQALVVELAVKKEIEIQALAGSDKDFVLRRAQGAPEDNQLLSVLGLVKSGDQVTVGPNSTDAQSAELSSSITKFIAGAKKKVDREGFFLRRALGIPALVFAVAILIFVLWFYLGALLDFETEAGFLVAPLVSFVPFATSYWLLLSKRALSAKGSQVVSQLKGLEMYIELAEKDRLEFLQSPKGALLKPSEIQGKEVLKLYEEVLPWAILLGLQKQWSQVLTALYQKEGSPVWYVGGPLAYANLSNLNKALSSSLAVSSSGGSGGSGSSGGGSGGGGGSGI